MAELSEKTGTPLASVSQFREHCTATPTVMVKGRACAMAERAQYAVFKSLSPAADGSRILAAKLAQVAHCAYDVPKVHCRCCTGTGDATPARGRSAFAGRAVIDCVDRGHAFLFAGPHQLAAVTSKIPWTPCCCWHGMAAKPRSPALCSSWRCPAKQVAGRTAPGPAKHRGRGGEGGLGRGVGCPCTQAAERRLLRDACFEPCC